MLVYRIENKYGYGPYNAYVGMKHNQSNEWSMKVRPGPNKDFPDGKAPPGDHFYGFQSIDDLTCWFTIKDRRHFKKNGLKAMVYYCPRDKVMIGGKQVAFVKRAAKVVDVLDVHTLEPIEE